MNQKPEGKLYTLSEACELLSISTATGRNWMKSGRLVPIRSEKKPLFTEETLLTLKDALSKGTILGLKSRRNKTLISSTSPVTDDTSIRCNLRHCAEQLILSAKYADISIFLTLLNALADNTRFEAWKRTRSEDNTTTYHYRPEEDTLGHLYQSLYAIGARKASGAYYTSAKLAKHLVEKHLPVPGPHQTVFDPSCGTGIFLLQLPDTVPLKNIFGNDINPVSVTLTRINLALKYHITTKEELDILHKNITVSDYLATSNGCYDIILGNPPWGAKLSTEDKKDYRKRFSCAVGTSMEIYDLFIEQSLKHLAPKGILSFVLPEAVLTVKSHAPVRELLLQSTCVHSVEYLGEAFEQVHCPSIIFSVKKDTSLPFYKGRNISSDSFSFSLTDEEYTLLEKINSFSKKTTLVEHSDFALGIVTGNNAALLHATSAPGLEPVIKGSDISKYHINSVSGYVAFQPERFQQTAPEILYRAPEKLFYRFINKQLIFAYDNTGLLSLNSCNILIPKIPGLSVKYILAVLNSSVAQFFFEKKFRSVKVLRSHLEQIPIPMAGEKTQEEIVALVDKLMKLEEASPDYKEAYHILDHRIAELFSLTEEEYKKISA